MADLAIIGGTGLTKLEGLTILNREIVHTPYGDPSGPVSHGERDGKKILFLPRHGYGHTIPPHKINYRANVWALKEAGASRVLAVAAVGGITPAMSPNALVIPDQIIDYTWSRVPTYFEEGLQHVTHIDFTQPYNQAMRSLLLQASAAAGVNAIDGGTYAATQGPRLETAAEINRLERDGCDIVGMTGMPEAALARELELSYATCAVVANWAAGRSEGEITMEDIEKQLGQGMQKVLKVLEALVKQI
ncbi:MAG: S-methyl-5'-thioinosine phosphorylase [Gammaproteobacteria bacterium]|nr:S-methyl-5'-thioinosine phosphorylase [Gammaproteobacteria bacterium]MDH5803021.1 S-methyl-5'-thioinosine phosphorylase [Gammaproteobacteria bacterium]